MATHTVTGVHPVADLFPMLDADEMAALAADIKANGLRQPIVLDPDGLLIDGRNRLKACEEAGVEPSFATLNGGQDPVQFIVSSNAMRRSMTRSQIAVVMARSLMGEIVEDHSPIREYEDIRTDWVKRLHKRLRGRGEPSQYLYEATRIVWYGQNDIAAEVVDGRISFDAAVRKADARRAETMTDEARLAELKRDAADLAARVEEGSLDLADAHAAMKERRRKEDEDRRIATKNLDTWVGYLVDLAAFDPADTASKYQPHRTTRSEPLRQKDIDVAIATLRIIKKGLPQ